MRRTLVFSLLLAGCAAGKAVEAAPVVVPEDRGGGNSLPVSLYYAGSGRAVTSRIVNDTDEELTFKTGIQIVSSAEWADAVPPIVGPEIAVAARKTGPPWRFTLLALPDGYFEVQLEVREVMERGGLYSGASLYLRVTDGAWTWIDFGEWHNSTGGAPAVPAAE